MVDSIKNILNEKQEIKLKIYALEYIIRVVNNQYIIYAELYPEKKEAFNTVEELLTSYNIYNEGIINNLNRVKII